MGIIDELIDRRDAVKVEKGDRTMSEDQAVYADDLGSCIGVAAYDSFDGQVYLAHFQTYGNDEIDLELEKMRQDLEDFSYPYEVFAGGTMEPDISPVDDEEDVIQSRSSTEDVLSSETGNYVVDWNETPVFNRLIADPDYGILYDHTF